MQLHLESHVERESARMCCLTLSKSLVTVDAAVLLSYFSVPPLHYVIVGLIYCLTVFVKASKFYRGEKKMCPRHNGN